MHTTRRGLLKGAGAIMAGAGLAGLTVPPAFAANTITLGELQIDTLSDGHLVLPGDFILAGMPQDALMPILARHGVSRDRLTPDCNVTLLRDGTRTVLFDVGSGPDFAPTAGRLLEALETVDVAPEDVTHVVFTHAHPDHLWGVLDDFDDPLFSEASYLIGKTEWDYWIDPNTVDSIGDARASFAVGAQRRLAAIEDRVEFFTDGQEVLPGVAARASFGHTPGHMAFEVRSGSNAVMIVGDAIGNHHVAFERPEWASGSDQQTDIASKTRVQLLDQLAADQIPMIGFHLPGGGLGRAERKGDSYQFVTEI